MSDRFRFSATGLEGVTRIERLPRSDPRGWLERLYCCEELEPLLGGRRIRQVNRTLTRRRGTIRGLHLQRPPHAEAKIVICLRGAVFDVAVDLRAGSPGFGRWHGERLTAEGATMLLVPEGCAHGFQTLADDCELLYLHTAGYAPESEVVIAPFDPRLAIAWPEPVAGLSERDAAAPALDPAFEGVVLE